MRHIIGILLQNESGALSRVAAMFSSRGYNIESLAVSTTQDATVSRVTLVTAGSEAVIQQIVAQLNKDRLGCKQPVCKRWLKYSRRLLAITNGWWKMKAKRPLAPAHANGKRKRWFRKTALFLAASPKASPR